MKWITTGQSEGVQARLNRENRLPGAKAIAKGAPLLYPCDLGLTAALGKTQEGIDEPALADVQARRFRGTGIFACGRRRGKSVSHEDRRGRWLKTAGGPSIW